MQRSIFGGWKKKSLLARNSAREGTQGAEERSRCRLGYGVRSRAALNMRDTGSMSSLGRRSSASWDKALADGWVPGKTLFPSKKLQNEGRSFSTCFQTQPALTMAKNRRMSE